MDSLVQALTLSSLRRRNSPRRNSPRMETANAAEAVTDITGHETMRLDREVRLAE
jgi:hypothetical protein